MGRLRNGGIRIPPKHMPETAIIIRTKNEERWIGECLKRLQAQIYRDFEIIIVDSGSGDRTLEIIKNFSVRVVRITPEKFSYPHALNIGCEHATARRFFVFLSAHSLPSSQTWLSDGLSHFRDSTIMGVYGFVWALPDGSIWEKLLFNEYLSRLRHIFSCTVRITNGGMGVLGFTNAVIRRNLWEQHHLDEEYGLGGEDGEWARYWFKRGFAAIRDLRFSVYHSHGLGLKGLRQQWKYWASLGKPQPFRYPEFRKKSS